MNASRLLTAEALRQVAAARPISDQSIPPAGSAGLQSAGHSDSTTYDWQPAGISNVTSTADPFYSADG